MGKIGEFLTAVERRVHQPITEVPTLEQFKATLTRQPSHSVIVEPLRNVPSVEKPDGLCGIRLSGRSMDGSRITCTKLMAQDRRATEMDKAKTSYQLAHRAIKNLEKSGVKAYIGYDDGTIASIPEYLREY